MNWTRIQLIDSLRETSGRSMPAVTTAMLARAQAYQSRLRTIDQHTLHDQIAHPPFVCPPQIPRPPSPLSITNYETIDLEGDPYDSGDDDEEEDDEPRSEDSSGDSCFGEHDLIDVDATEDMNLMDFELGWSSSELERSIQILGQVSEGEKQQEVSFAQFDS